MKDGELAARYSAVRPSSSTLSMLAPRSMSLGISASRPSSEHERSRLSRTRCCLAARPILPWKEERRKRILFEKALVRVRFYIASAMRTSKLYCQYQPCVVSKPTDAMPTDRSRCIHGDDSRRLKPTYKRTRYYGSRF